MIVKSVPFLGLEWCVKLNESSNDSENHAAVVRRVVPNSPAHRAGVQAGDVIHSVDGAAITSESTLTDQIIQKKPGAVVVLDVTRNKKRVHVRVVLGERQLPTHRYMPAQQSTTSRS